MKAEQVNKLYAKLTPNELAVLAFEALSRLNEDEMDIILDSVPRKEYICPHKDYVIRMTGLQNLSRLYGINYWKNRTLMLMAFNIYSDDRTCSIAKQFIVKLASMEAALIDVCGQVKIDAELIKTMADCKGETQTVFNDCVEAGLVEQYTELFTRAVMLDKLSFTE